MKYVRAYFFEMTRGLSDFGVRFSTHLNQSQVGVNRYRTW